MPLSGRRRRWIPILSLIGAATLLAVLALPLWFPWVLRPIARQAGLSYARYERQGYARFVLRGVSFTNRATVLHAERVEAPVPTAWLWRLRAPSAPGEPLVRVGGWEYLNGPRPRAEGGRPPPAVSTEVRDWTAGLRLLRQWLPVAELSDGRIRAGKIAVPVPTARWTDGRLRAEVVLPHSLGRAELTADVTKTPYDLRLRSDTLEFASTFLLATNRSGLSLSGTGAWSSNRFEVHADFGPEGLLPETATLDAPDFVVPPALSRLPQYTNLTGSLRAQWARGQYHVDLRAGADPVATQTNLPPLELALQARGDTNAAVIQTAALSSPWLTLDLSRELTLFFTGPYVREPASLKVAADLARQPWFPLQGKLSGEADLSPGAGRWPAARFRLSGAEIGLESLAARSLTLAGNLNWPTLELARVEAGFADGSTAGLSGNANLDTRILTNGTFRFQGPLARRWLPPGYSYQDLEAAGTFEGPFSQIRHHGRVTLTDVTSPQVAPLTVKAEWSGLQARLADVDLTAEANGAALRLAGKLAKHPDQVELHLTRLSLSTNGVAALALARPCRISVPLRPSPSGAPIGLSPLELAGPGGRFEAQAVMAWPAQAALEVSAAGLSSALVAPFSKTTFPEITVHRLALTAGWTNGPALFHLALDAAAKETRPAPMPQPGSAFRGSLLAESLRLQLEVEGNANGLAISNLAASRANATVATAEGFLPLTLSPTARTNWLRLRQDQPLRLTAAARPDAFFWDELAAQSGLRLRAPQLQVALAGTWAAPDGRIELAASQVDLEGLRPKTNAHRLPALEGLRLRIELDRQRARLVEGHLLVQGEPVSLTAEAPLRPGFWTELNRTKLPDWRQWSARLRIEHAQLASFEPLVQEVLAPQGELNVDVALRPGGEFAGAITVTGARTRPLGSTGPLRNIEVSMRLHEQTLTLEQATADLGGSSLAVKGQARLGGTNWLRERLPPFELSLLATNVPLARQPEFILRSDLLFAITKTNGAPPLISGRAALRDSYYLSDLGALIPLKVSSPTRRPPYFSIDNPFLADWRLALDVTGERWLKVRSTVFNGEISTSAKIQGTLKDPLALGNVKIESGLVRFPFASLQVQQGFVTLLSQDPYRPVLNVRAASKQFGYDIHLEATGPVDAPVIQFTSNPPLSSEQILLMVTAGELPQGTFSLTTQQKAQTVAMFLGRDLLMKLGVGDQTQQRLTIRSGEEISQEGHPTYRIEYKLSDNWSLVGEYDRFSDYNAGFKWRVYSK